MRELTSMQQAFVAAFVRTADGPKSAVAAGFSEASASQRAYELKNKPHIQEAIQKEMRRCFTDLAAIALDQARLMLLDPKLPASARVALLQSVWDRAGLAAPKDGAGGTNADKPLHQFSLAELEAMAARSAGEREGRAPVN